MPGMHKSINTEEKLSNSHRKITKKHLSNLRIDKCLNDDEKDDYIRKINDDFRKNGLTEIYSKRKLYEAISNKKYRLNYILKKKNKKKLILKINKPKIEEEKTPNNRNIDDIFLSDSDFNDFILELNQSDILPIF